MELKVLDADKSQIVIGYLNIYSCVMIRQQVGNFFGPLNKAVGPAVKIFLVAHVQRLGLCFKAIKIEMKNAAIPPYVFVNDRKCRAGGWFLNAHFFAQGFDERSFAGTHIAIK